jgi:hypothetical protein
VQYTLIVNRITVEVVLPMLIVTENLQTNSDRRMQVNTWKIKRIKRGIKEATNVILSGGNVQDIINMGFKSPNHRIINTDFIKTIDTGEYILNPSKNPENCNIILEQVETEYSYEDLRPSDILLDIGANIGVFSLKVRNRVRKVFAVEPLFIEELQQNINLNNAKNIEILPYALGNGNTLCEFEGRSATITGKTLSELINLCGGHIDFLKIDCEGAEWSITPEEIKQANIRRIEGEIHGFNGENMNHFVAMLQNQGYKVKVEPSKKVMMIHAFK